MCRFGHADFNIDQLPFPEGKFDLVTCTEVFEHLENYRHALREAARVLKPGGLLVVSTPERFDAQIPLGVLDARLFHLL